MAEVLSVAQMRAAEEAVMASGATTGLALMECAGRGVVEAIFKEWPAFAQSPATAVVLCGPGNNGGDGFVIARRLRDLGWSVDVLFWGDADRLSPEARRMYDQCTQSGPVDALGVARAEQGERPHLLVDAMFGIGVTRPIPLECAQAWQAVVKRPKRDRSDPLGSHSVARVAVDCPSGFDCDRGAFILPTISDQRTDDDGADWMQGFQRDVMARFLPIDLTVTFHAPKRGHVLDETSGRHLSIVDIGLPTLMPFGPPYLPDRKPELTCLVDAAPGAPQTRAWLRHAGNVACSGHKYDRGHVLVLAGGVGRGGAARLAARAALRAGAGLVTVGAPAEAIMENAARLDAVMLRAVDGPDELAEMLKDTRLSSIVIGPGFGIGPLTRDMVRTALDGGSTRRVVLDADALTSFSDDPDALFEMCHEHVVLTPHAGEFARLFPDLDTGPNGLSSIDAVRLAAMRSGAVVLLKGPATVMARPDGAHSVHSALRDRAAPQLATAGSGDVLAGIIAGCVAAPTHHDTLGAVELAVWLHAEAARQFGPGLIAEDLPDALPSVYRACGL